MRTRLWIFRWAAASCSAVLLFCAAPLAYSADRDIVELQREVSAVSDQVNNLQTALKALQDSLNDKLTAQATLQQQTLDRVNQVHTDNTVSASMLSSQFQDQQQKLAAPVAALSSKLDQVVMQFSAAQDSLSEVNSRLGRLEQKMTDLENAVKVMQAGPAAPPSASAGPGGPPNGITAAGLFQNASADQLSGKADLALQEYRDYLQYYGNTELAASAQFHVGEILLNQGKLDDAVQAFDAVRDQYGQSPRAADALYLKAQALERQGKRTLAIQTLNQLVRQYADSDSANLAKNELARLRRPAK